MVSQPGASNRRGPIPPLSLLGTGRNTFPDKVRAQPCERDTAQSQSQRQQGRNALKSFSSCLLTSRCESSSPTLQSQKALLSLRIRTCPFTGPGHRSDQRQEEIDDGLCLCMANHDMGEKNHFLSHSPQCMRSLSPVTKTLFLTIASVMIS